MPSFCPPCKARIGENVNCIQCDFCRKWHHFECSDLTQGQFEIYTKDKSFDWYCKGCDENRCKKCDIVSRHGHKIQCQKCENLYHLKCAWLSKNAYIPTTSWYCYQCNEDIFPFNTISPKKILSLSYNSNLLDRHPNRFKRLHIPQPENIHENNYSPNCRVCTKTVSQPTSAIPCQTCMSLIHKTCSNLKDNGQMHSPGYRVTLMWSSYNQLDTFRVSNWGYKKAPLRFLASA